MESKHYKIIFKKFEIGKHVEYTINLSCENDPSINIDFKDRYSNLKDLHEGFKKEANSLNFPKFPPKKLWGNTEEKFLAERKIKLQHYFNTILGSKDFMQLKTLNRWINDLINTYSAKKNKNKSDDKLINIGNNNQNLTKSIDNNETVNKTHNSASHVKNHAGN